MGHLICETLVLWFGWKLHHPRFFRIVVRFLHCRGLWVFRYLLSKDLDIFLWIFYGEFRHLEFEVEAHFSSIRLPFGMLFLLLHLLCFRESFSRRSFSFAHHPWILQLSVSVRIGWSARWSSWEHNLQIFLFLLCFHRKMQFVSWLQSDPVCCSSAMLL